MGESVAVTWVPIEPGTGPGYRRRFRREAESADRLADSHVIAPLDETGDIDGQLYLVLPVINGTEAHSLDRRTSNSRCTSPSRSPAR